MPLPITPEQYKRIQEIAEKASNEYDREKFNVLIAELLAQLEETDRAIPA
jgi:hypothetical protein